MLTTILLFEKNILFLVLVYTLNFLINLSLTFSSNPGQGRNHSNQKCQGRCSGNHYVKKKQNKIKKQRIRQSIQRQLKKHNQTSLDLQHLTYLLEPPSVAQEINDVQFSARLPSLVLEETSFKRLLKCLLQEHIY